LLESTWKMHKLLVDVEELADEVAIRLHTSRLNSWFVDTELWRSLS